MKDTEPEVGGEMQRVGVVGAGTMGHGIAQVAAHAGLAVVLQDVDEARVAAGLARIGQNLDKGVARGKVTAEQREATLSRIVTATDLQAMTGADVVIESVPERIGLKREVLGAVAAVVSPQALLCSNTSSLSVTAIAADLPAPERVIGTHFFNPVHLMKLVELVVHPGTAPAALRAARALVERLGKTAITVRDAPGFASSRLGIAIGLEAMRMVEQEVASAADIDTAMRLGYGHPMGPIELTDLVGLDIRLHVAEHLAREIGPSFEPPEILRRKVGEGKLGKKTGEGFYRWRDGKRVD